jgi:hypothetical protein
MNGAIFGGGDTELKICVSLQFLSETKRDMIKNIYWPLHVQYRYSCQILMELEFS